MTSTDLALDRGTRRPGLVALYGVLAVIGAVLPLSAFLPWLATHGIDAPLFVELLFANPIGSFFGWDVIVSAVVLTLFVAIEGRGVPGRWWAVAATCLIGVSCGLPLFLALRART